MKLPKRECQNDAMPHEYWKKRNFGTAVMCLFGTLVSVLRMVLLSIIINDGEEDIEKILPSFGTMLLTLLPTPPL